MKPQDGRRVRGSIVDPQTHPRKRKGEPAKRAAQSAEASRKRVAKALGKRDLILAPRDGGKSTARLVTVEHGPGDRKGTRVTRTRILEHYAEQPLPGGGFIRGSEWARSCSSARLRNEPAVYRHIRRHADR